MPEKSSPAIFATITLDPTMFVFKSKVQLEKTLAIVKKILSKANYYGSFELTKQQNIHYHIYICGYNPVRSPLYYWKNKFRRGTNGKFSELGFTKIEIANSTADIINYINKDVDNTHNVLGIHPIIKRLEQEQERFLGV